LVEQRHNAPSRLVVVSMLLQDALLSRSECVDAAAVVL